MGGAGIVPSNCLDEKSIARDSFCRSVSMITSFSGEPSADGSIASYPESWCTKEAGANVCWGAKGFALWKECVWSKWGWKPCISIEDMECMEPSAAGNDSGVPS